MKKLRVRFKKRWVEALRSGKYEQGKFTLISPNRKFCCLGVAFDLLHPGEYTVLKALTYQQRKKIGLGRAEQLCLTMKNDYGKQSFDDIANWIEKNL